MPVVEILGDVRLKISHEERRLTLLFQIPKVVSFVMESKYFFGLRCGKVLENTTQVEQGPVTRHTQSNSLWVCLANERDKMLLRFGAPAGLRIDAPATPARRFTAATGPLLPVKGPAMIVPKPATENKPKFTPPALVRKLHLPVELESAMVGKAMVLPGEAVTLMCTEHTFVP